MKLKLSFLLLFLSLVGFAQKTTVTGVISDKDLNNEPLPFANVNIKGKTFGATTDMQGKYTIEVPAGDHTIVFSFLGYETKEVKFTINAGETKEINEILGSGSVTMEDVVVKATVSREKETALLLEQKKAVEIKQSIGAQEMARKGVSDVEEGLTKITGITKVDGRGLFVRGLEDRYNNLLINDLQAPSNTPFTKIIPLDIFPTDIVGVLNVYKTFNPNIPGDFAGATMNIETTQPKKITKLSVGFGFTTQNNNQPFLIHENANNNEGFFGLNGQDRQLSSYFGSVPSATRLTPEQYKEAYKNNSWNVVETTSPINNSISFLHSDKVTFDNSSLNYIISINGDNKYTIRKGVERTFLLGSGDYDNNFNKSTFSYSTNTSTLAGLKYKRDRFDISGTAFYLRSTDSEIKDQLGYTNNQSSNPNILIRSNQFDQSDYLNGQLTTNIKLTADGKHSLKGGTSYVKTQYQQPDRKFIIGEKIDKDLINVSYGGNNLNRQDLEIKGNYYASSLLEYTYKFKEKDNGKANKLVIGHNFYNNNLFSKYRIFSGLRTFNKNYTAVLSTIDSNITEDINNGILTVREESNPDYKSKFKQLVNSGYANMFLNFGDKFEINGGVRFERSQRTISYRSPNGAFDDPYTKSINNKNYFLPSINAKYELNEKSNLRFSTSQTITRPVTMEVLPIVYINPDGTSVKGNQDLEDSKNFNADFKYEIFPADNQMIAVGVFGKKIVNPIETVFIPSAGGSGQLITYQNSKNATIYGAEIETVLPLSKISKHLDNFSLGFNTSLMKTKVNVDFAQNPLENKSSRRLQGASEWLINSDFKYEFEFNEEMKNTMTLVYGVYGDRIQAVGSQGIDHRFEKPFHKLDFVWTSKFTENIEAKLSIDNILNPLYKVELGNESTNTINESSLLMESYKRGTGFNLNITYNF
ncbi:TonB-dependent receptor [Flavobacterium sp. H122]|uniref:TonB-dependent receptor n=1 Tax=Flavobacterium sp. H122 TaxID=2529860 RepID=UPI0010A9BB65|nr:TonB-dependent receptor [Flavobacterium sp. H122]